MCVRHNSEYSSHMCFYFQTGVDQLPHDTIDVKFKDGSNGIAASTCFSEITLPTSFQDIGSLSEALKSVLSDVRTFNIC